MTNLFRAVLLATVLTGCYRVPVTNVAPNAGPSSVYDVKVAHTVIYGLIPLTEIDARDVCGDRPVWSVDTRFNGISWIAAGLTAGIYVPMYAKITCAE